MLVNFKLLDHLERVESATKLFIIHAFFKTSLLIVLKIRKIAVKQVRDSPDKDAAMLTVEVRGES